MIMIMIMTEYPRLVFRAPCVPQVVLSCTLGLGLTRAFFSPLIFAMYLAGLLAGGLYSIPPFYFKRFPIVAAITIAFVRGFSLNFGVSLQTQTPPPRP
jgi:4-hydroxybenzoate polyprenyltransferase